MQMRSLQFDLPLIQNERAFEYGVALWRIERIPPACNAEVS